MFCAIIQAYVDGINSKIFPVWGALRTAGYNEKQMFNTCHKFFPCIDCIISR